jgi:hypothetical protein
MCHIGLVAGWDGDRVDITALRGWNIQQILGWTFSEKSVELDKICGSQRGFDANGRGFYFHRALGAPIMVYALLTG